MGRGAGGREGPGRHRLSSCHPSQLRTGLGYSPGLCLCCGLLRRWRPLFRSSHTRMLRAPTLKFAVAFPAEPSPVPLNLFDPGPISGPALPSDLFLSPTSSSLVPTLSLCQLLTTLWDHLPLEVDPCARDHGGCSPHANCTKVAPGQRTCTCQDGYTGDGELCQGEAGVPTLGVRGARGLASVS